MEKGFRQPDADPIQEVIDLERPIGYELDDRFVIRDGKKHKCAIICPGGGYYMVCSSIEGVPFARKLNEKGISAVIVFYRVREQGRYPNPMDDLARAVKEVFHRREEFCLDMENYSVWGSSAGGHLAGSFGTASLGYGRCGLPRPGALVLVYPVISMEPGLTHQGSHDYLLGENPGEDTERRMSLHHCVDPDYPATFIWCGTADRTVDPENTRLMAAALEKAGVRHRREMFPGIDHGVGPGTGTVAEGWLDRACEFWLGKT